VAWIERDSVGGIRLVRELDLDETLEPFMIQDGDESEESHKCKLWLIDRQNEVTVFFNSYFRMLTGVPMYFIKLYAEKAMSVSSFSKVVNDALALDPDDQRFALFAYHKTHTDKLAPDDIITDILVQDDPMSPFMFQFQMLPECEDQKLLGVTRASNLYVHTGSFLTPVSKKWCALKGTTLFIYKNRYSTKKYQTVERMNHCRIVYRDQIKKNLFIDLKLSMLLGLRTLLHLLSERESNV